MPHKIKEIQLWEQNIFSLAMGVRSWRKMFLNCQVEATKERHALKMEKKLGLN
jgi:hypothetical protein